MTNSEIKELAAKYLINNYGERQIALVRGEGVHVWDADGKKYLDFVAGISVNNLGHCHPKVVEAITEQARKLIHVSNLYYIEPQTKLARRIVELSFADKCFFCNSGAEANEAAIKVSRKYSKEKFGDTSNYAKTNYIKGDMSTTVIRTAKGKTMMIQHNITNPRPYSRIHMIAGTKGFAQKYPITGISFDPEGHTFVSDQKLFWPSLLPQ